MIFREGENMFYVSEIKTDAPEAFKTSLQQKVYQVLAELKIPYKRVDTDEAITMEDCVQINAKLDMDMVKTLFLCNKKKTLFYLFITTDKKPFDTKKFCEALEIPRVSFAPQELFEEILETKIGAATIYSVLDDWDKTIQVIFDQEVADSEYYGCSDGTTTGYMKVKTEDILTKILPHSRHKYKVICI